MRYAASGLTSHPSLTGPRGRPPTVSRYEVSTVQTCCLLPVFRSIAHRAAGSGRPQCHGTRCRLRRCAASGRLPIRLSSAAGGLAARSVTARGVDCAGVLPPDRLPFYRSPGRGVGRPQVLRPLVPSVWPFSPWSPFRHGRYRSHADSDHDTNIPSGRSVSCAIDDS